MALYEIQHRTAYQYASTVSTSHHAVRIEPLNGWGQTLHSFEFSVSPEPRDLVRKLDYFANPARFFSLTEPHQRLVVEGRSRVSVHPRAEIMAALTPTCEEVRRLMHTHRSTASLYATAFVYPSPRVPTLAQARDFAEHILQPDRPYLEAATALARKIHSSFAFKAGVTDAYTPIVDFLKAGKGVCQDFAHFMIACLRACALPAAYVSGYIRTKPPPPPHLTPTLPHFPSSSQPRWSHEPTNTTRRQTTYGPPRYASPSPGSSSRRPISTADRHPPTPLRQLPPPPIPRLTTTSTTQHNTPPFIRPRHERFSISHSKPIASIRHFPNSVTPVARHSYLSSVNGTCPISLSNKNPPFPL
jgi:transglutaminase-like putative cysteine protease